MVSHFIAVTELSCCSVHELQHLKSRATGAPSMPEPCRHVALDPPKRRAGEPSLAPTLNLRPAATSLSCAIQTGRHPPHHLVLPSSLSRPCRHPEVISNLALSNCRAVLSFSCRAPSSSIVGFLSRDDAPPSSPSSSQVPKLRHHS
jgi:hypothetical protein